MKRIIFSLILLPSFIFAQYTPAEKIENSKELPALTDYKNTVRWNMTPMVLFGIRNVNLGYERVLTKNSTASINIGYLELPKLLTSSEEIEYVDGNRTRGGFSVFVDYKRYITNRNKRSAPEGLYWGGFVGLYNQKFGLKFNLVDPNLEPGKQLLAEADLNTTINNINFGLQLGYQFVFYDRFTVDLVLIGPSASLYTGTLRGSVNIHDENIEENEVYKKFVEMIMDKAPGLADIVDGDEIYAHGTASKFAVFGGNFRYVLQIGYRF